MTVVKKYRGNFAKCLATYIKERITDREDLDPDTLFLPQTVLTEECRTAVSETLAAVNPFTNTFETIAGCTVSCHCGPGTVGLAYIRK